jgi:hypothetical protein
LVSMKDADMLFTLRRMGFTANGVVEVILVTRGADGKLNAAPMGARLVEGLLEVRPYKANQTYRNLGRGGEAALNVTHDPLLFLAAAFKGEAVDVPKVCADMSLQEADSCIYVAVQDEARFSDAQASFKAEPIKIVIEREYPIVFSRGRAEAIEAVIHATRVKVFQEQRMVREVRELTEMIARCAETVRRVSPVDSPEGRAMVELYRIMADWGVSE